MQFPKLKAVCQDCLQMDQTTERKKIETLVGPLTLTYSNRVSPRGAMALGFLLMSCGSHHAEYKDPNDHEKPQHRQFKIYREDGTYLGDMGATSEYQEIAFWIQDGNLQSEIAHEGSLIGKQEKK